MARDPVCGMNVDEKKGLRLSLGRETYFFCSRPCLEKFAAERGLSGETTLSCLSCAGTPFYRNKTFLVSAVLILAVLLSFFLPLLVPFRNTLLIYFRTIWWAVLLGLFLGGIIDYYVPREYVSFLLARPGKKAIVHAVLLGFLMSACSHGILALAIQLHKKGASNPAVVAFLLATPWANITLTIMLVGFFGLPGLYIITAAVVIALISGFIFQFLEKKGMIESNSASLEISPDFSLAADLKKRLAGRKLTFSALVSDSRGVWQGAVSLGNMVLWWILIGMGLASLAGAYVPAGFFRSYMGPTPLGLLSTLALATVIEVCSEGSAPMAFELFRQTRALGNSFVFLMAGVVTDYTEIGLLWHNVGRKTALALPLVTVPQVIILGLLFNFLLKL